MHKDLQLCAQVARALALALSEIDDDSLAGLELFEVAPAPDATRLRVVLGLSQRERLVAARAALLRHGPRLRSLVATMIHRKRVPELAYVVVPPQPPPDANGANDAEGRR